MAYRTYINDHEWLGNNIMFENIYEELKRQGCPFNDDGYVKSFQVKDLDALVKACERDIVEYRKDILVREYEPVDIASASHIFEDEKPHGSDMTLNLIEWQSNAFIFISANLIKYVGRENIDIQFNYDEESKKIKVTYALKEGAKCEFKAY